MERRERERERERRYDFSLLGKCGFSQIENMCCNAPSLPDLLN
jgi:hypothetical protein